LDFHHLFCPPIDQPFHDYFFFLSFLNVNFLKTISLSYAFGKNGSSFLFRLLDISFEWYQCCIIWSRFLFFFWGNLFSKNGGPFLVLLLAKKRDAWETSQSHRRHFFPSCIWERFLVFFVKGPCFYLFSLMSITIFAKQALSFFGDLSSFKTMKEENLRMRRRGEDN